MLEINSGFAVPTRNYFESIIYFADFPFARNYSEIARNYTEIIFPFSGLLC